ncbi:MAG: hypothetical protein N2110_01875 [Flavobacteriales bacterium]|nr:hypothetical protein [Flavobacteriales bacterium]
MWWPKRYPVEFRAGWSSRGWRSYICFRETEGGQRPALQQRQSARRAGTARPQRPGGNRRSIGTEVDPPTDGPKGLCPN